MCPALLGKNNQKRTYKISQKIAWNHQKTATEEIWTAQSALNQTRRQCINKPLRPSSRKRSPSRASLTRSRSRQLSYCHLRETKTNLHPISSNKMNHQPKVKVKAKLRSRACRRLLKILTNTKRSSKSSTRLIWTKKKTRMKVSSNPLRKNKSMSLMLQRKSHSMKLTIRTSSKTLLSNNDFLRPKESTLKLSNCRNFMN